MTALEYSSLKVKFMRINIKGTNIELTDELRAHIMEKFSALERFFPDLEADSIITEIEVGKPSQHHRKGDVYRCGVTMEIEGTVLTAEETRGTPHEAIDLVREEIERQIRKLKAKQRDRFLRRARKAARGMKLFRMFRKDE